jgi:hypothetical protein
MYDRPTAEELLDAARTHLEMAVIPVVRQNRKLYFQTLVAINVLRIVERELQMGASHAQDEWLRLNALQGVETPLPARLPDIQAGLAERNGYLKDAIRSGNYDGAEEKSALFNHLKATVIEQLQVANPRYLQKLAAEDTDPALDAWESRHEG